MRRVKYGGRLSSFDQICSVQKIGKGQIRHGVQVSRQALKRLTNLCHEEVLGLRVYVVIAKYNKLPNVCLSFDMTDLRFQLATWNVSRAP